MNILEDFSFFIDADINSIDQVTVFDGHNLMVEVHEDNILGVVLNAEFSFHIVHDIIDSVGLTRLDLLSFEVNLHTPKNKTLLVLLRLFEEDIDNVVD